MSFPTRRRSASGLRKFEWFLRLCGLRLWRWPPCVRHVDDESNNGIFGAVPPNAKVNYAKASWPKNPHKSKTLPNCKGLEPNSGAPKLLSSSFGAPQTVRTPLQIFNGFCVCADFVRGAGRPAIDTSTTNRGRRNRTLF